MRKRNFLKKFKSKTEAPFRLRTYLLFYNSYHKPRFQRSENNPFWDWFYTFNLILSSPPEVAHKPISTLPLNSREVQINLSEKKTTILHWFDWVLSMKRAREYLHEYYVHSYFLLQSAFERNKPLSIFLLFLRQT